MNTPTFLTSGDIARQLVGCAEDGDFQPPWIQEHDGIKTDGSLSAGEDHIETVNEPVGEDDVTDRPEVPGRQGYQSIDATRVWLKQSVLEVGLHNQVGQTSHPIREGEPIGQVGHARFQRVVERRDGRSKQNRLLVVFDPFENIP